MSRFVKIKNRENREDRREIKRGQTESVTAGDMQILQPRSSATGVREILGELPTNRIEIELGAISREQMALDSPEKTCLSNIIARACIEIAEEEIVIPSFVSFFL